MPTKIWSAALSGLDAVIVAVEADAGGGDFGNITIVGLPDAAISEAKERVKSALRNCGLPWPRRKITVNLAPADLKKHGPAYDLPMAIGILALKNNFKIDFNTCLLVGELSLNGEIQAVNGLLSMALAAQKAGITTLFVPAENASEAQLIKGLTIYPLLNLSQLIQHLQKIKLLSPAVATRSKSLTEKPGYDLGEIKGQEKAKRALEIAAAGSHNLLLFGSPGAGKTLLARGLPGILPPLNFKEKLEVSKIYSAAGELKNKQALINFRPFRSPHHSISGAALVGGGAWPRPGEISLAHRGVLFSDELPEFSRSALENLRQPLEEGAISITRTAGVFKFPAQFMLLAAINPCPCGYLGDKKPDCHCSHLQISNYRHRISGPIIDRIDLHVEVPRVNLEKLQAAASGEESSLIRQRVARARSCQQSRFKSGPFLNNAEMTNALIKDFCPLDRSGHRFLIAAGEKVNLSARSYFRILKLARTIADLAEEKNILIGHLAEALQYRPKLS